RIGVATWLFYLIPLGSCIFLTRPGASLLVAGLSTLLIVIDYFFSPTGESEQVAMINRGFATVVIWAFAVQTRMTIMARQSLRKQDWMRVGQSTLAQRVLGELTLQDVGERIVTFVGEYLGASVGALYARQSAREAVCIGGYALPAAHPAQV